MPGVCCATVLKKQRAMAQPGELTTRPKRLFKPELLTLSSQFKFLPGRDAYRKICYSSYIQRGHLKFNLGKAVTW